jgi:hypothetical protein
MITSQEQRLGPRLEFWAPYRLDAQVPHDRLSSLYAVIAESGEGFRLSTSGAQADLDAACLRAPQIWTH